MLVDGDEANFDSQNSLKLYIINANGESTEITCFNNTSIDKIKSMAMSCFGLNHYSNLKSASQYKLISMNKKKMLADEASIRDENLINGETLLLLAKYPISSKFGLDSKDSDQIKKGFNESIINEVTKNLIPKNLNYEVNTNEVSFDVSFINHLFFFFILFYICLL